MRAIACVWIGSLAALPALAAGEGPWREAVLGLRSDAGDGVWNFVENGEIGRVGASAMNRGQVLSVNGSAFAAQSAFMRENGNEFLFSGQAGGVRESLVVVRRVRLDPETGVVRHVELLRNESGESRSVQVELRTTLNGYYERFASDGGREMPVQLRPEETGFWLEPSPNKDEEAGFAFAVVGPGAAVRPTLGSRRKYVVSVFFELEIAPGETAALLHAMRRAPLKAVPSAEIPSGFFAALDLAALRQELPPAIRGEVRNVAAADPDPRRPFLEAPGTALETADTLALTGGDELRGTVRGSDLALRSAIGGVNLELPGLVALSRERTDGENRFRAWLRSGEVVSGTLESEELTFATGFDATVPLLWDNLEWLRFGRPWEPDESADWVWTRNGDQLRLADTAGESPTKWETAHGLLEVSWGKVRRLERVPDSDGKLWLTLNDGSRLRVMARRGALPLKGIGAGQRIALAELRGFRAGRGAPRFVPSPGRFELDTGECVPWRGGSEAVRWKTTAGTMAIPWAKIRAMRKTGEDFRLTFWDGSTLTGLPASDAAANVDTREGLRIRLEHIRTFRADPVAAGADFRTQLEDALQGLQSDAWPERRGAEQRILEMGIPVIPLLREMLPAEDPDLEHRLGWILEELEAGYGDAED